MGDPTREVERSEQDRAQVTVRPVHPDDAEGVAGILNPIIDSPVFSKTTSKAAENSASTSSRKRKAEKTASRGLCTELIETPSGTLAAASHAVCAAASPPRQARKVARTRS